MVARYLGVVEAVGSNPATQTNQAGYPLLRVSCLIYKWMEGFERRGGEWRAGDGERSERRGAGQARRASRRGRKTEGQRTIVLPHRFSGTARGQPEPRRGLPAGKGARPLHHEESVICTSYK